MPTQEILADGSGSTVEASGDAGLDASSDAGLGATRGAEASTLPDDPVADGDRAAAEGEGTGEETIADAVDMASDEPEQAARPRGRRRRGGKADASSETDDGEGAGGALDAELIEPDAADSADEPAQAGEPGDAAGTDAGVRVDGVDGVDGEPSEQGGDQDADLVDEGEALAGASSEGELEVLADGGEDGEDSAGEGEGEGEGAGDPAEDGDAEAALPTSAATMDATQLKMLVEALVFASDKPLTIQRLRQLTRVSDVRRLEQALADLATDCEHRGVILQQVSGGYQLRTRPQFSAWVQQLIAGRPVRLSRAQLETLAIVAYRQPITRPEIDEIRGVDSSATLKLLMDRALVRVLGKKEEVGRPMLYGTTKEFLDFFSLGDLRELPTLREYSELSDESRKVMSSRLGIDLDSDGSGSDPGLAAADAGDGDGDSTVGDGPEGGAAATDSADDEADDEADVEARDLSALAESVLARGGMAAGDDLAGAHDGAPTRDADAGVAVEDGGSLDEPATLDAAVETDGARAPLEVAGEAGDEALPTEAAVDPAVDPAGDATGELASVDAGAELSDDVTDGADGVVDEIEADETAAWQAHGGGADTGVADAEPGDGSGVEDASVEGTGTGMDDAGHVEEGSLSASFADEPGVRTALDVEPIGGADGYPDEIIDDEPTTSHASPHVPDAGSAPADEAGGETWSVGEEGADEVSPAAPEVEVESSSGVVSLADLPAIEPDAPEDEEPGAERLTGRVVDPLGASDEWRDPAVPDHAAVPEETARTKSVTGNDADRDGSE